MLVLEGGVTTSSRQRRLLLDTQAPHAQGHPIRESQHLRGVHLKVREYFDVAIKTLNPSMSRLELDRSEMTCRSTTALTVD